MEIGELDGTEVDLADFETEWTVYKYIWGGGYSPFRQKNKL